MALCDTITLYLCIDFGENHEKPLFSRIFILKKNREKLVNLAVALCGTMWHYIYVLIFQEKNEKKWFYWNFKKIKILTIWLWHYVALCGTIFMYCFSKK